MWGWWDNMKCHWAIMCTCGILTWKCTQSSMHWYLIYWLTDVKQQDPHRCVKCGCRKPALTGRMNQTISCFIHTFMCKCILKRFHCIGHPYLLSLSQKCLGVSGFWCFPFSELTQPKILEWKSKTQYLPRSSEICYWVSVILKASFIIQILC